MTDQNAPRSSWNDEPLQNADIAGRAQFAQAVAARIGSVPNGMNSTVFGLVGPWGSGKTTLLRDITGQLPGWTIAWFSPWSVTEGSISTEFVSALSEAFPESRSLRKKLVAYSRFGAPILNVIPIVGGAASAIAGHAISELSKKPAWHSEFEKISREIAAQHRRVLMVVDDVDRLDGDELRSLLRVVRLLGRFTNVHYLMAYDQATIDVMLGSTGAAGSSSEFMEKIVQFPFEVPPVPLVVRRRWGRSILDVVSPVEGPHVGVYNEHREELIRVLAAGLETPRAAERLREQLLSLAGLVADAEVDVFDFTVLTWLRIAHHQVWDSIRLNPDDYISWRENDSDETRLKRMAGIEALVTRGQTKPVRDALSYLFEPMEIAGHFSGRRGRMQKERYFHRYFQVGLAEDDVSERMTQDALNDLGRGLVDSPNIAYLKSIFIGQDHERSGLALDIASNLRPISPENPLAILDFVDSIRTDLNSAESHPGFLNSSLEHWLRKEIFIALKEKMTSDESVIGRFGYELFVDAAYSMEGRFEHNDVHVRSLYTKIARSWASQLTTESLDESLAKAELPRMTYFCIWVNDSEETGGFLSEHVVDGKTLIEAAAGYVTFDVWGGRDTTYDLVWRKDEFRYAVTDAVISSLISQVPKDEGTPSYRIARRPDNALTEAQRLDFARRSLLALISNEIDHPKLDSEVAAGPQT